jgi:6-phosphogluconolactonase (cycloisomerase 2 family)
MRQSSRGIAPFSIIASIAAACGGGAGPAGPDAGQAAPVDGAAPAPGDGPGAPAMMVYAGGGKRIGAFRFTPSTGALAPVADEAAGDDARFADLDATGRHLYVQSQMGPQITVLGFTLDGAGKMEKAGMVAFPYPVIEGVSQVLLHPSGRWFLISVSERLAGLEDYLMPVEANGQLGPSKLLAREFYGFNWDPTGKHFYGFDGEAISQFGFDQAAGTVTARQPPLAEGSSGRTVLGLRVHPGGRWAYSIEESALGQWALDPDSGIIANPVYLSDPVDGEPALWTSIVLHAGGGYLFAAGYVADTEEALVDVFRIDAAGALRFVEREKAAGGFLDNGLQAPLVIDDWVIVGGKTVPDERGVLSVLRLDRASGGLTAAGAPLALPEGATASFVLGVR